MIGLLLRLTSGDARIRVDLVTAVAAIVDEVAHLIGANGQSRRAFERIAHDVNNVAIHIALKITIQELPSGFSIGKYCEQQDGRRSEVAWHLIPPLTPGSPPDRNSALAFELNALAVTCR